MSNHYPWMIQCIDPVTRERVPHDGGRPKLYMWTFLTTEFTPEDLPTAQLTDNYAEYVPMGRYAHAWAPPWREEAVLFDFKAMTMTSSRTIRLLCRWTQADCTDLDFRNPYFCARIGSDLPWACPDGVKSNIREGEQATWNGFEDTWRADQGLPPVDRNAPLDDEEEEEEENPPMHEETYYPWHPAQRQAFENLRELSRIEFSKEEVTSLPEWAGKPDWYDVWEDYNVAQIRMQYLKDYLEH
eukprot:3856997-Pyramimonas_sp.AAC.1